MVDLPEDPDREGWLASLPPKPTPISGLTLSLGSHVELGRRLVGILGGADNVVFDDGDIYHYDERRGIWLARDQAEVERIIHSFDGATVADKPIKIRHQDVVGSRKRAEAEVSRKGFFAGAPYGVCFKTEFVRIDRGIILREPHNREHRCRAGLDCDYFPGSEHPLLDEFFDVVFGDVDEKERGARVALLQEFLGACLFGLATSYQACLVLLGKGDNGKSAMLRIVEAMFPKEMVSSIPPQQWGIRFQNRGLVGMLLNLCNEIPEQEIVSGSSFKSVITGDPQSAEAKYGDPFTFKPRAGHLFSANAMPATRDHTLGFFRRWLILPMTRNVRELPCHRPDAAERILVELPAIVAWAIDGAVRLQQQEAYTIPESAAKAKEQWRKDADSAVSFISERCSNADMSKTINAQNGTTYDSLYKTYREWCSDSGFAPLNKVNFRGRLEGAGYVLSKQADNRYFPLVVNGAWSRPHE